VVNVSRQGGSGIHFSNWCPENPKIPFLPRFFLKISRLQGVPEEVRLEVRRWKLVRQDRDRGNSMDTFQGHREKINRCREWGLLKLLLQALKLLMPVNSMHVNHNLIGSSASAPDLRAHQERIGGHAQCPCDVCGLTQM
jgi:hypothetical protein